MRQSRKASLAEAITNVVVGYWIAVAVQSVVFPLLGIRVSFSENIFIGAVFTAVSILRSYALRRLFERFRK